MYIRTLLVGTLSLLSFLGVFGIAEASTTVSGVLLSDTTWTPVGSPYVVMDTVIVPSNVTLTILPGTIVKMTPNALIRVSGTLNSGGTTGEDTFFTSIKDDSVGGDTNGDGSATSPQNYDWKAIYFHFGSHANISETRFFYPGAISTSSGQYHYGALVNLGGIVIVRHSSFRHSSGVFIEAVEGRTSVRNSIFIDGTNGVYNVGGITEVLSSAFVDVIHGISSLQGSLTVGDDEFISENFESMEDFPIRITGDSNFTNQGENIGKNGILLDTLTLPSAHGMVLTPDTIPYIVRGPLIVPVGMSLTIASGVIMKMDPQAMMDIAGSLTVSGTKEKPVTITSVFDDSVGDDTYGNGTETLPEAGNWQSITIRDGAIANVSHANIRYAGVAPPCTDDCGGPVAIFWNEGGNLTITDSTLSDDFLLIRNIAGNTTISNSSLLRSTDGILSEGGTVDARNNWWGDASGPRNLPDNPFGTGLSVQGDVQFAPWLPSDPILGGIFDDLCIIGCNSNVMFLPGVMGSRLYDSTGQIIWLSEDDEEADTFRMNSDGTSASLGITTYDALDTADAQQLHTDVYKSFLGEMKNWERDYHITATTTPYDWRLDYDDVVNKGRKLSNGRISYLVPPEAGHDPYLLETLKRLASSSPTGKVTIIGHSQGGLVAKALMQKIGTTTTAQLIDKVIFVAAPQLGTPQAIATMLNGTDAEIPFAMSAEKIRQLAQYTPSAYNLLPSANYFTYVDDPVITISSSTLPTWSGAYGGSIHWDQGMYNFMSDASGLRTKPGYNDLDNPEIVGTSFLEKARTAHNSLDAWVPPSGVKLVTISGWGEETLSGVLYFGERVCLRTASVVILGRRNYYCAEYGSKVTPKPQHVIDGDGTVVEPSAQWANGASSTRYWVNLPSYNKGPTIDRNHKNILEVPQLRALIAGILTGVESSPDYISTVAPVYTGNDPRLHFTLHSPLTLEFYDILGNHVGYSTSTGNIDLNIPDVRYEHYGKVQWLSVPKSLAGRLVMNGTGSGSFTLDVEEVNGDDTFSSTSFAGIPSSTSTVAIIDINPNSSVTGSSTLVVDEEGDGISDITLEAKQGAVVLLPTLDITAPTTTASTTGSLGTNGWYTSNVVATLTATDTGSGVASTTYSLNNGVTWVVYASPVVISTEGFSTFLYRSADNTGNMEATSTLTFKIDKTAPEATVTFDPVTQKLKVIGSDNLSSTTVSSTASSSIVADDAGHTLKVVFVDIKPKTKLGRINMAITALVYDEATTTLTSTTFKYKWATTTPATTYKTFAAFLTTKSTSTEAHFRPKKGQTIIMTTPVDLDDSDVDDSCDARPTKQKFTGMVVPRMDTSKGVVTVNY